MSCPPTYDEVFGSATAPVQSKGAKKLIHSGVDGDSGSSTVSFTLNGTVITVDFTADQSLTPSTTLAEYIRAKTKWTGTKIYCHEGGCGVCVVNATYSDPTTGDTVTKSINSCLRPLAACGGMSITTNDGLGNALIGYHPIQQQLAAYNGSQCGFCSNGMVMTMHALLSENPTLTPLRIEQEFDGNLCRCTGYRPILEAMKTFAAPQAGHAPEHDDCGEDDCRKTGCKRAGKPFPEMEELGKHMPKLENYRHVKPKPHQPPSGQNEPRRVSIAANGCVWQDCPTLSDLNMWLPWYVAQGSDPMLVVGQTSLGVFATTKPTVKLYIADIPELYQWSVSSTGVTIGASTTIANVINILSSTTGDQPYQTAHFPQAVNHLRRIASHPIRNVASIFGNIALTARHQAANDYFCGDGATVLYGLGATFSLYDTVAQQYVTLTVGELFDTSLKGKYCLSIFIPFALPNELFMSYKIAMRQVNAHAYVNAAMRCVVDPATLAIQGQPTIVYGGIGPKPTRITQVETQMIGAVVTDVTTFQSLVTLLSGLLSPTVFMGKQAFRKSVALNYFYKFFLYLQGQSLPANLQSGSWCWMVRDVSSGTQSFMPNPAEYPVSIGMPKIEAIQQTSGAAKYTEDLPRPVNTLFACVVLAQQANCELDTVDYTAASQMNGFVAFYQASDIQPSINSWQNGEIFSTGQIAYYGQCVGVVLATTHEFAMLCADAVNITYKNIQTPIVTIKQAIAANSYVPAAVTPPPVARGNAQAAMATAAHVITGTVEFGYQYHFHMENHVTLVIPREDVLEIHSATQMPVVLQQQCAAVSGYPMSKVVVSTKRCGGGFGGKLTNSILPASIATIASVLSGAPVELVVDLQHTTAMLGCRGGKIMDYTVGVNSDGTIVALEANVTCASGVFYADALGADMVTIHSIDNAYYIPNAMLSGKLVAMNTPAVTAVRGPGWVPGIHFGEAIISNIASNLNMDPMAVREANFIQRGQTTCDGMLLSYWNMPAIWSQLKASSQYATRVASVATFNAANRWVKRGLAMVPIRFGVGQTGANYDCLVNIYPDGTVSITHGGSEIGQGINTKVIQVAAFKLGLSQSDLPMISVNETCTRSISAMSNVTGGSVTSELCSLAVMHACETLSRRLAPLRQPNQSWAALIAAASNAGIELTATGFTNAPVNTSGIFNYNSNGAALTEVEVDGLTGQFEIRQVDILFDCGQSLNPTLDIGQLEGGFMFGLGLYTQEDPSWDPVTGQPQQPSTWEYKPPSAYDIPLKLNLALLNNTPNPVGVLGSKAVGEPGVALATSVVQALESAVTEVRAANGLGSTRWVATKLPFTVDRIQQACGTTPAMLNVL